MIRNKVKSGVLPALALVFTFALAPSASAQDTVNYVCGQNSKLTAVFMDGGDKVRIRFPGADNAVLDRIESGSGAKYSDGDITFWSQGDGATLKLPGFDGKCTEQ